MEHQNTVIHSARMPTTLFLNADVIAEILARLPAKDIARLRCVCKKWLSLTYDPCFIKYHTALNPHPSSSGFFFLDHICGSKYFPLNANPPGLPDPSLSFIPTSFNGAQILIQSSCNGLVICCQAARRPHYETKYYVCNPTTKQFIELPKPNERDRNFSLVFDLSKSPHYKVVSMGSQILVYSSETRSWKLFKDKNSLQEFGGFHYGRSVYLNGALIWASKECLLSFDAEGESMKKLPMPPEPHQCSRVVYLGSSGGKLQMIVMRNNEKMTATFDILEMDSQCSGWSVLHHVDLSNMLDLYPGVRRQPMWINGPPRHDIRQLTREHPAFLPVHFMHGEKEGVEGGGLLLLCVPRKIVSYNLKDKAFTEVCDIILPRLGSYCLYGWQRFQFSSHTLFSP